MGNFEKRLVGHICECASTVCIQSPSREYGRRVALLLAETGSVESGFRFRRQEGMRFDEVRGGWGYWQTEFAAIGDGLRFVLARPELCERFENFTGFDVKSLKILSESGRDSERLILLHAISQSDRLGVALCRAHYLRMPGLVGGDVTVRSGYWKKYYNTILGSGTLRGYLTGCSSSPVVRSVADAMNDGVASADTPGLSGGVPVLTLSEAGLDDSGCGGSFEEVVSPGSCSGRRSKR